MASSPDVELVIEGGPRPPLARSLRELVAHRDTLLAFAERSQRLKYKQTVLGLAWSVLQPLTLLTIFVVALGRLSDVPGGGVPYAAFALSALVPWTFLSAGTTYSAQALVNDAALLRKVYFPREVPVIAAQLTMLVDLGVGLLLYAVLGPILGAEPSAAWLLAPLLVVPLFLLGASVSILFAGLNVHYRDFRHALPFLMQLWLFASPVAYPITVVPGEWRWVYATLNPAAGILDSFRRVLALGELPDPGLLALSCAGTVVVALVAYRVFKGLEPAFADVV
ncbi:MAG TPA: ABC transporter permease [Acidimicrobiales bacterium]|nr:ABC transporter permease [Acidimicrobiales bacterium]